MQSGHLDTTGNTIPPRIFDHFQREVETVGCRLANLVDAPAEGLRAPDISRRPTDLQARRAQLAAALAKQLPTLPADMAAVCGATLAHLTASLAGSDHTEAREAARPRIDKVIITPPTDPDDPPCIKPLGDVASLIQAAGLVTKTPEEATAATAVLGLMQSSLNDGPRARSLLHRIILLAEPRS